jgi:hypothetical protein
MNERSKFIIGVQFLCTFYLESTETFSTRKDTTVPKMLVVLTYLLYCPLAVLSAAVVSSRFAFTVR